MKKYILLIIISIFLVIFLSGCSKQIDNPENSSNIFVNPEINKIDIPNESAKSETIIKESICNPPYIEYKKGECCPDTNSNKLCDNDEKVKEETNKSWDISKNEDSYDENTTKVINALKDKGCDIMNLDFILSSTEGNIARLYVNENDNFELNQVQLGFIEMYKMWGNNYDEYVVVLDNTKIRTQNPNIKHTVCTYWGNKMEMRDAVNVDRWDNIHGYCNEID